LPEPGKIGNAMPSPTVLDLLLTRSVLICVGAGGVGKTSVTAALSVAAAQRGRRVLALTVDPALRLAESLGVSTTLDQRQWLDARRCAELGIAPGTLSVMMLDPARTWTELIQKATPNEAMRDRILNHPLYRVLVQHVAGANEYMAMEKLLTVLEGGEQDLILLDTPPSRHALDFLRAPTRLADAVDSPILRGLAQATAGGRRFSMRFVSQGILLIVRTMGGLMGASMLEQLAELVGELDRVLGGLRSRAERVRAAFRDPSFAYVLVSRPNHAALADTLHFERELERQGLLGDAVVLNGVKPPLASAADSAERAAGLREVTTLLDSGPPDSRLYGAVRAALSEYDEAAAVQRQALSDFWQRSQVRERAVVGLPWLPRGPLGTAELRLMAEYLSAVRSIDVAPTAASERG
jgi:anion-transporting  ArsA/GET3 family ATPase